MGVSRSSQYVDVLGRCAAGMDGVLAWCVVYTDPHYTYCSDYTKLAVSSLAVVVSITTHCAYPQRAAGLSWPGWLHGCSG